MKPTAALITRALCVAIVAGLVPSCDSGSTAGNSSEAPNAAIGVVFDFDHTPASNATVVFVPTGADPRQAAATADTAVTDSTGHYCVSGLAAGRYNVLAHKSGRRALIDSVHVAQRDTSPVPDATLGAVGSVSGVVKLEGNPQSVSVYLLLLGSTGYATADSAGRFTLGDLAGATYAVRILTTAVGYGPKDMLLSVRSGFVDTLADTVWIYASSIAVPARVAVAYDTTTGVAHIRWAPTPYAGLLGYLVYRCDCDATVPQLVSGQAALTDTAWDDTLFPVVPDTQYRCVQYRVRVQDQDASMGGFSTPVLLEAVKPGSGPSDTSSLVRGLVAYYPFSGNAQDASGTGNNGTVYGAALTADRHGTPNSAYTFPGSAYVEAPHSTSLDCEASVSVVAWARSGIPGASYTADGVIVQKGYMAEEAYGLCYQPTIPAISGTYRCHFTYGASGYTDLDGAVHSYAPLDTAWHFYVMTFDGDIVLLYRDGGLVDQFVGLAGSIADSPLRIGAQSKSLERFWRGAIDDVRIYNRCLSIGEVLALYGR